MSLARPFTQHGRCCQPYGFHWALRYPCAAVGTGGALVEGRRENWFFMTADTRRLYALEKDTGDLVKAKGGQVVVGPSSLELVGFLLVPDCRRKVEGEDHWPGQCGSTPPQLDQTGGGIRIGAGGKKLDGLLRTIAEVHGWAYGGAGAVLTEELLTLRGGNRNDTTRGFSEAF